ncbi:MAG: ATP-binding protein [Candidatus Sulfobium sp.]
MFSSLYSRLAAVLLALFVLAGSAFVAIGLYMSGMYQEEVTQKLNSDIARHIVEQKILVGKNGIDRKSLEEVFDMLMVVNPGIEIYLLDPEGSVLAFSAEPGKIKARNVDVEPIRRFLSGNESLPILGVNPRNPGSRKIFSAARIPAKGKLEGYLYVILGGEVYDTLMQKLQGSYILRLGIWGILASLTVAVLAGLIVFGCLTRRLRRLATAMGAYREGIPLSDLDLPSSQEARGDEIDMLVSTFREMAQRIETQVKSMKKSDSMRRELVANVSHDLRTPLATLQGYLETLIMKNEAIPPEERQEYLDTALSHCRRLGKLVSDLFDLAKLEAQDTRVRPEPFNLGELVQDVIQKFRLRAEDKKIRVITNISIGVPMVDGDIGLIERVIENLVDNALSHTPEEGTVSIVLSPAKEVVTVDISDTGPGIPGEEIPRIFERFYQLDKSRRYKAGHSGLGLAIAKQILELHGSSIQVKSRLHMGTTFSFSLPVHPVNGS